jgi:hypothetical protein
LGEGEEEIEWAEVDTKEDSGMTERSLAGAVEVEVAIKEERFPSVLERLRRDVDILLIARIPIWFKNGPDIPATGLPAVTLILSILGKARL